MEVNSCSAVCVFVRACVCVSMRACVRACMRACPFIVLAPCVPHGSVSQMDNTIMVAVTVYKASHVVVM